MRSLYWLKNDLRLLDNTALSAFAKQSESGLICWFETKTYQRALEFRKQFIDESILDFQIKLKNHKQDIYRFNQPAEIEIPKLIKQHNIQKIFFTADYSVEEIKTQNLIINFCNANKIAVEIFDQQTLILEKDLPFKLDQMPFVFSDFRRSVEKNLKLQKPLPEPSALPTGIEVLDSSFQPKASIQNIFSGGETEALKRLKNYIWVFDCLKDYKETRNGMIDLNDSTKLSPWLSLGCISPRIIYQGIKDYESQRIENQSTYWLFFELLWRDYFKFFAKKYKNKIFLKSGVSSAQQAQFEWPDTEFDKKSKYIFQKWCEGTTQDPFINANMIELKRTGWMSNRGRQNVASFLVHNLNLPWTWGAAYFEKMLLDYDAESNWGNWLYLSGKGSDPRAREFNTQKQARDYDPQGLYQQKWLSQR
jgi:deoxyribodipyrimidine photo-lyase